MSNKDYKEGMVAGAKPFGDKLDQLADVVEEVAEDLREGVEDFNNVKGIVNIVLDDLSTQEKKRIYDLDESTDVSVLEDDEKEFLVAVLAELANTISSVTELQKRYIMSICSTVGITPQASINLACIENINNMQSQKIILRHVMEFFFIGTQNYDFIEEYDESVFSYFSVNKRGINEMSSAIDRIYNAMGIDGLANRYTFVAGYEEFSEGVDDTEIEQENPCESEDTEVTDDIPEILEELHIGNMVQISPGETLSYRYKEIQMGSLINCCGTLEFDHCVIVYNKSTAADEISTGVNAEIRATNCTFICRGIDSNFFITLSENCRASFEKCVFVDCSYFLSSFSEGACLTISNSEMYNCSAFATLGYCTGGEFSLINSKIVMNEEWSYDDKIGSAALFCANTDNVLINHTTVSGCNSVLPLFFEAIHGKISNCTFTDIRGEILCVLSIEKSVFENCIGKTSLITNYLSSDREEKNIKACIFDNCKGIICADNNSVITQCKFVNCSDDLIRSTTSGAGIEISYCEFINYKNTCIDERQGKENSDPVAAIKLYAEKNASNSIIKKCIFDGIDINEGFLVSPSILGKLSGKTLKIIDCDFRNCSTKRTSGKIIKTYGYYYNLFDTLKNELAITIDNCRGLDSVKQNGNGICTDKSILSNVEIVKASTGSNAMAVLGAGLVGGPVALVASGIGVAVSKKKEKELELSNKAKAE